MSACDDVIRELLDGNERYRCGETHTHDFSTDRDALAGDQRPIAAVLTCSDSRVVCEHLFDQGPGKLFVVRVAGNFLNEDGLASIEFAVEVLGVQVVLVLGHSSCGAISATIEALRDGARLPGHLSGLVSALREPVIRCEAAGRRPALECGSRKRAHDGGAPGGCRASHRRRFSFRCDSGGGGRLRPVDRSRLPSSSRLSGPSAAARGACRAGPARAPSTAGPASGLTVRAA